MQDILVATVIHDLKNELAILAGNLATMTEKAAGTAIEADVRQSRATAAKLSQKLVSFLTIYRAHDRGLPIRLADHNPEDFLHDLVTGLVLGADAPLVCVAMSEPVAPFWFFDAYLVQMSIEAAIQNAVRFARTTITLSARMRDGFLVFVVEDDGCGLKAQRTRSTGLGTALCSAIAAAHRNADRAGTVTLKDRPQGGAVYEMWLP